jgi:hypothetical protein
MKHNYQAFMRVSGLDVKDSVSAKTVFLMVFNSPLKHPKNPVMPSVAGFFCVCTSFLVFLKPRIFEGNHEGNKAVTHTSPSRYPQNRGITC